MAFQNKIKSGEFVVTAEMETPKGVDISSFVESARHLKGRLDAVVVPDMNHAVMRLSALAGAKVLLDQGLDVIIQFSCRDRNRLALQADLLGAHVLGLRNVMAVVGEPVEMGDQIQAKPVYDLSPGGFLETAAGLMAGKDLGGMPVVGAPSFCIGAKIEPWSDKAQAEVRLAEAKLAVDKGASFLITPPVFDTAAFEEFMSQAKGLGVPVVGAVLLLKSVGMARYLNQNLPGVKISEDTIRRIRLASDRPAECVKIAAETIGALKSICGGAHILTAGWENRLPEILDEAGL